MVSFAKAEKTSVLSKFHEDILWEKGVVGMDNHDQLRNAVFLTIGMACAMRAGKEHHQLRSPPFESQFTWEHDDSGGNFIRYTQDMCSKTNRGGLKHRKVDLKVVDIYPISGSDRDPVKIIEKYISVLPKDRISNSFYLHSKKKFRCSR